MNRPKNILLIRNDKLGDFMLSLPCFAMLKQSIPEATVHALVPEYTRGMAEACPWIDKVIIDPGAKTGWRGLLQLAKTLRRNKIGTAITLFSTTRIGIVLLLANIPYRLAPATKLAQLFYNHKLKQRRSRSEKPEYEYNLDLVRYFLTAQKIEPHTGVGVPYLQFETQEVTKLKQHFCQQHGIDCDTPIVFIHPGSGGSANNLTTEQYAGLALSLSKEKDIHIVISAGPGEKQQAEDLSSKLTSITHTLYHSTQGLQRFAQHIQFANLFVSGSTGPLHIAGALNTPTAAFYPRRQSATALRWQTLNSEDKRLAFSPPTDAQEGDMSRIDVSMAAKQITQSLLS